MKFLIVNEHMITHVSDEIMTQDVFQRFHHLEKVEFPKSNISMEITIANISHRERPVY
jgi:hypothetical protein